MCVLCLGNIPPTTITIIPACPQHAYRLKWNLTIFMLCSLIDGHIDKARYDQGGVKEACRVLRVSKRKSSEEGVKTREREGKERNHKWGSLYIA